MADRRYFGVQPVRPRQRSGIYDSLRTSDRSRGIRRNRLLALQMKRRGAPSDAIELMVVDADRNVIKRSVS
jgi:hypothetical protein